MSAAVHVALPHSDTTQCGRSRAKVKYVRSYIYLAEQEAHIWQTKVCKTCQRALEAKEFHEFK